MELWQILVICVILIPFFFAVNYMVVMKAARERRDRDERIERSIAGSIGRDYRDGRFVTKRYRPRKPGMKR
ncbi:MAG: hypothetical protein GKC10_09050 [Methanosarcinales archaeon]|nr:hypothetical protein [Methanosarcinales archaeon]